MSTVAKNLVKAAEYLDKHGLYKGWFWSDNSLGLESDGPVCMLGAYFRATNDDQSWISGVSASEVVQFSDDKKTTKEDAVLALLFLAEFARTDLP